MSEEFHFMVRRRSDERWLTWGAHRNFWSAQGGGHYPDEATAVRDGKYEAPGDFEVLKQAGVAGITSDAPMEVIYSEPSS